jgi:hypothetical protein
VKELASIAQDTLLDLAGAGLLKSSERAGLRYGFLFRRQVALDSLHDFEKQILAAPLLGEETVL